MQFKIDAEPYLARGYKTFSRSTQLGMKFQLL